MIFDFRRVVLRTRDPTILKIQLLRFPTFCSANQSPRNCERIFTICPTSCSVNRSPSISESASVEVSDVLFCESESPNFLIFFVVVVIYDVFVLRIGVPEFQEVHLLMFPVLLFCELDPHNLWKYIC